MSIHTLHKTGVLGVLCVPESLQASNGAAFSDGTPEPKERNTTCSEHERCSAALSPVGQPTTVGESNEAHSGAEMYGPVGGAGGEAFDPFDGKAIAVLSTCRWVLVPDEENPQQLLWEWNPWQLKDDIDELFTRVRERKSTDQDHELFDACMIDRFIQRVHADEPVEPWILHALADALFKVMMGGVWDDEIRLPGRPRTQNLTWREQRDFDIYTGVMQAIAMTAEGVTSAIQREAEKHAVSYETARAAYYKWKPRLSKKPD